VAFLSDCIQNVLIVRWIKPESGDSPMIAELVAKNARRLRKKLVYVGVVPKDSESPSEAVRREMIKAFPPVLEHCECVHLVLEGHGLSKAVIRTVAAGIFLVGGQRGRVTTHDSVRDALEHCPHLNSDAQRILKHAKDLGFTRDD
jgi:hypothetical protein